MRAADKTPTERRRWHGTVTQQTAVGCEAKLIRRGRRERQRRGAGHTAAAIGGVGAIAGIRHRHCGAHVQKTVRWVHQIVGDGKHAAGRGLNLAARRAAEIRKVRPQFRRVQRELRRDARRAVCVGDDRQRAVGLRAAKIAIVGNAVSRVWLDERRLQTGQQIVLFLPHEHAAGHVQLDLAAVDQPRRRRRGKPERERFLDAEKRAGRDERTGHRTQAGVERRVGVLKFAGREVVGRADADAEAGGQGHGNESNRAGRGQVQTGALETNVLDAVHVRHRAGERRGR